MTVLGIESATQVCSAAIVREGTVIAKRSEVAPQRHAELLLPFVEEVMADANLKPRDLDTIAVSIGPGSFTGLRIGLSVVKGISAGTNVPVVPVPTMDAAAYRALQIEKTARNAAVIFSARRHEYYYGRYGRGKEKPELNNGIIVYSTDELVSAISDRPPDVIAGEGIERLLGDLDSRKAGTIMDSLKRSIERTLHLNDAAITAIICKYYDTVDIAALEPLYIKEFETGSPKHKQQPRRPE